MRLLLLRSCFLILVLPGVLTLSGCKKQDDAKSGVVGHLLVDGGTPDGASALLFEDPSGGFSDADVWYATARQPQVGFPYNPRAAFDWRKETALLRATVPVEANGDFNISGQVEGNYFLVVEDSGFGWTTPIAVNLNQPTVDVGTVQLYVEQSLAGTTSGTLRLLADHHYVIGASERLIVSAGDTLILEPGAVVRGDDAAQIRVQGSVVSEGTPENWVTFTSNWRSRLGGDDWEGLSFQPQGNTPGVGHFSYTSFMYCFTAIRVAADPGGSEAANCEVDNCYFTRISGVGVDASNCWSVVTRSVFNSIPSALRYIDPDSIRVEHNVIFSARSVGVELQLVNQGSLFCNWFHNCGRSDSTTQEIVGVTYMRGCQNLDISYNNFQSSWYAFNIRGGVIATTNIHHNRFSAINRVMDVQASPGFGGSNPTFQNNCMTSIDRVNLFFHPNAGTETIDARFNFWNSLIESFIQYNYVHDCQDDIVCPCVEITPILTECPAGVGICAQ